MSRAAKNKGVKFQNETRDLIKEKLSLNENDIRTQTMGASGDDIILAQAAIDVFPYAVECKRQERLSVRAWLDQAYQRSNEEVSKQLPVVVFRQNYCQPFIVVEFEHFLDVVAENVELKKTLTKEEKPNDSKKTKRTDKRKRKRVRKESTKET